MPADQPGDRSGIPAGPLPDAVTIARRVRSGERTARSVIEQALHRISATNGAINAFVEVRASEALRQADDLDRRIAAGEPVGRMAGVPVAVKDSLWEAGVAAANGSRALLDFVPSETAEAIERLTGEDGIVIGRTNVPEFCYRGNCANEAFGGTLNPWDTSRTPGGSTGGGAAAVAAGMVPVALGSDGGGSLRIPASFCGLVGYKPTFGLVPRTPGWQGWYGLNHLGPLTANVADAALVMDILSGRADSDPASLSLPLEAPDWNGAQPLTGLRVAYSRDLGYIRTDQDVQEAFDSMLGLLAEHGVELIEDHPHLPDPGDLWYTLASADNVATQGELLATGKVGDGVIDLITAGEGVSGPQYARARIDQHDYSVAWQRFLSRYDFFLTPAMECAAFPAHLDQPDVIGGLPVRGVEEDWCQFVYPFNVSGHPAVSLPAPARSHLPHGVQAVAGRLRDIELMRFAAAVETAVGGFPRAPELGGNAGQATARTAAHFAGEVLADGTRVRRVARWSQSEVRVEFDEVTPPAAQD